MLDQFIPFSAIALGWAPCHRSEGFSERDVSSLRAFGPGGRQVLAIAHVSARAFLWMSDTLTTATHTRTPAYGGFAPPRGSPVRDTLLVCGGGGGEGEIT